MSNTAGQFFDVKKKSNKRQHKSLLPVHNPSHRSGREAALAWRLALATGEYYPGVAMATCEERRRCQILRVENGGRGDKVTNS